MTEAMTAAERILMSNADLALLSRAAEELFPDEACALLEGQGGDAERRVTRVHLAANVAEDRRHRFEVDPRLLLRLYRESRDAGRRIVGVWHSHPNGAARPSRTDLAQAYDPSLIWLITPVADGRAGAARAFCLRGAAFAEISVAQAER